MSETSDHGWICPDCGDDLDGDGMHVGGLDCATSPWGEPS